VAETCDRVSVMYAGFIVETAAARDLIDAAAHPYSRALIDCIPRSRARTGEAGNEVSGAGAAKPALSVIPGFPPRLYDRPSGCPFAPRCSRADSACAAMPDLRDLGGGRQVLCHHPFPVPEKVKEGL
jgi:oligopeptide/dipeptide ABC transporter ATP-binding protein